MNHPIKIALFSATLFGGGAERVIVTLANGFHRAGYPVDVVLVRRLGEYLSELDDGVQVVDLASTRTLFALFPLIRYLHSAQPTAMLSVQGHVNAVAVWARTLAKVKLQLLVRESTTASINYRYVGGFTQTILKLLYPKILKESDLVIAPSEGVAADLISEYNQSWDHIRVIPNPLDISRLTELANSPLEPDVRLPLQVPIILAVGRLNQAKDYPTLIYAFAKVREKIHAHLMILGEGEDRASLEHLVSSPSLRNHVSMPGFVNNPFPYMKQAAVYVLSSKYEGLPNTLLQALAVGTPSVATDCPSGPREILEGGRWGRLVPVGDVNLMAEAIIDGLRGHIARPSIELMEARYGIEGITQKYLGSAVKLRPHILAQFVLSREFP